MTTKTPQPRIRFDHSRREVFVNGREVHFPPIEYAILRALVETNKALTREDLGRAAGYDEDYIGLGGRVVDQHCARIRRKVRNLWPDAIITVSNVGYKIGKLA